MRTEFLPFAMPDVDGAETEAIQEVLSSGWLTTGDRTREFERAFADGVGAPYAVAVNSCTAALHLALGAAGVQRGDEVVTTPFTFAATAEVIRYFDATPVLVDVDPDSLNIDPDAVEEAVTERTKAVLPVHLAGLPAELDDLHAVAERHGLQVVEDAAHAFPAQYRGRMIGSASRFACFSFYATKTITTGEGGMICTDDAGVAARCRSMALHGIDRDAWKRSDANASWYYEITEPGYKYNLTDLAAAIGLAQLSKAERMWERRREIAARYTEAFRNEPALQVPHDRTDCKHAWHLYMLRLHLEHLEVDRARFIEEMRARNIGTSVHFIPLHLHPYYRETYGFEAGDFPIANREFLREVSLPIYSRMTDDDVEDVIEAVRGVVSAFSTRRQVATG